MAARRMKQLPAPKQPEVLRLRPDAVLGPGDEVLTPGHSRTPTMDRIREITRQQFAEALDKALFGDETATPSTFDTRHKEVT